MVITLAVTLLLLAAFLGTNDAVSGFFDSIGSRLSLPSGSRNIDFTLTADNFSDMSFNAKNPVNLTIDGATNATLKSGNLQTNSTLSVYGFRGTGSITGTTISLDGKISKVELPEIAVAVQETITSNSIFTGLSAVAIEMKTIKLHATGSITVRNSTIQYSGDVEITDPAGDLEINRNNHVFYMTGKASKITIPGSGVSIG